METKYIKQNNYIKLRIIKMKAKVSAKKDKKDEVHLNPSNLLDTNHTHMPLTFRKYLLISSCGIKYTLLVGIFHLVTFLNT